MKKLKTLPLLLAILVLLGPPTLLKAQIFLNYSVSQPAVLSAHAGPDLLICPGDLPTIGGTPAASGGYNGYSFQWMPGAMVNNALAPNPIATVTQSTVFTLTVSDSMGCSAIDTMVLSLDTCIGIVPGGSIATLDVFPNPNHGRFTVKADFNEEFAIATLQVVDIDGRRLFEKTLQGPLRSIREQIKLDGFSRGAYFVLLQAGGTQVSRKIVLQ